MSRSEAEIRPAENKEEEKTAIPMPVVLRYPAKGLPQYSPRNFYGYIMRLSPGLDILTIPCNTNEPIDLLRLHESTSRLSDAMAAANAVPFELLTPPLYQLREAYLEELEVALTESVDRRINGQEPGRSIVLRYQPKTRPEFAINAFHDLLAEVGIQMDSMNKQETLMRIQERLRVFS